MFAFQDILFIKSIPEVFFNNLKNKLNFLKYIFLIKKHY
jgi:hypothetical protein